MKTHAIIEIEEGSLTLTIGAKAGNSARIFSCERFPLSDTGGEAVGGVLRGLGTDPLRGAAGVHVIVGDRRASHFVATVPKMPPGEVADFVTREALRVSSLTSPADLMVAPRLLRQPGGGRLEIAASALPASVWQPFASALEASGMEVLALHTSETCLALAAPADVANAAILEYSGGRARFVLCDGDAPARVRRFILGSSEGGSMALAAQLAIELPRTYDWLRENGHSEPRVMVLGNRLCLDDDSVEMLRGELEEIDKATFGWELPEEGAAPGLATLTLMGRLFDEKKVPSLLARPEIRVPWSRARIGSLVAAAAAGVALSVGAVADARGYMEASDERARVSAECARLEQQAFALESQAAPAGETSSRHPQLELALSMRRPISRLIAEVSNNATDRVYLEALEFSSTERITVRGVVKGRTRQEALAVLSQFVNGLRALAYFEADGQDEVNEVPGKPHCLRFQLGISWRNS